ncbi:MAG: undecaprenyldiphospho-muramoylpentapeptide beta-N-acetylglucosaminyltransferase [Saprospiraceae bacterium]|nr:undecaprenyldiphospho-muramoylpentapeptide beta-N-acetylglucosaminyltransferase [Candidatus Vicinibacter proximus]MCC6842453.1 undecaprenyldiphospho-muramoylpentapeptide beta-N-acetylglucosaminyltransferase [Saprospiraceae bacterium]
MIKVLISGGGTGGHVFPAIAIADSIKEISPLAEILFVGASGRLEMVEVPKAGYRIEGLNISGFQRKFSLKNIMVVWKLIGSMFKAFKIVTRFAPDVVVGVGGYASGPVMKVAAWKGIPYLIQEQNSYPGITNKLMASKASAICVAFPDTKKYFNNPKIEITGNPVRKTMRTPVKKIEAYKYFNLDPNKKTLCFLGGSLGAKTINEVVLLEKESILNRQDIQVLWQCGRQYEERIKEHGIAKLEQVHICSFIDRMDYAYAVADVAVTRAGALTISELAITETVSILVPSPNVAEDHQRKNAEAMTNIHAAVMILDVDAPSMLWKTAVALLDDYEQQELIKINLHKMAKPDAAMNIAKRVLSLAV